MTESEPTAAPGARALPVRRASRRSLGAEPALLLSGWALRSGAGRLGIALLAPLSSPARRAARLGAFHQRAAERLVRVLAELKGVYVKAGQFAAHRHDVVPDWAHGELVRLRDRVSPLPLARVRATVEAELGAPLEELFRRFDAEPLGAASLAQVHRAQLPSGELVAVKVQYPWLEDSLDADLALVRRLLGGLARVLAPRGLDPGAIFAEFAAGLREELDFRREATVAAEIAANLRDDPQIVVPRVVAAYSSRRVLCVEYLPAVRITDRAALDRLGVANRDVLEIVTRAYAKQVFVDGLFHADPHPGNLFVVDEPQAAQRPRVLFVDFGLSRRLDPSLRSELRRGLYAVVQRDPAAFVDGMRRMGMIAPGADAEVRRAVDTMLERIGSEGGPLGVAGARVLLLKDEAKALLQETPGVQLPNDLLLFAKTLAYVFGLGRELDPEVDLMRLVLPSLLQFLAEKEPA